MHFWTELNSSDVGIKSSRSKQGGHSSGKPGIPGKVRELKSGQGKFRENEL